MYHTCIAVKKRAQLTPYYVEKIYALKAASTRLVRVAIYKAPIIDLCLSLSLSSTRCF